LTDHSSGSGARAARRELRRLDGCDPPASYLENGETQTYRSHWQPAGRDAYDVVIEFQVKDRWVPGFKLHMEKVTPAKLKEPKR